MPYTWRSKNLLPLRKRLLALTFGPESQVMAFEILWSAYSMDPINKLADRMLTRGFQMPLLVILDQKSKQVAAF